MKFITEYDLRARFQKKPFAEYQLKEGIRLTPGARQFLSDQRITIQEPTDETLSKNEQVKAAHTENLVSKQTEQQTDSRNTPVTIVTETGRTDSVSETLPLIMAEMEQLEQKILDLAKASVGKDMELTLLLIDVIASSSRMMNQMAQILHTCTHGNFVP